MRSEKFVMEIEMADERVGTGIRISRVAYEHLRDMAEADKRNPTTAEIEWLIEQEWMRRGLSAVFVDKAEREHGKVLAQG
jgi:hypothetical protein